MIMYRSLSCRNSQLNSGGGRGSNARSCPHTGLGSPSARSQNPASSRYSPQPLALTATQLGPAPLIIPPCLATDTAGRCRALTKVCPMTLPQESIDKFVRHQNVERYRRLLENITDENRRGPPEIIRRGETEAEGRGRPGVPLLNGGGNSVVRAWRSCPSVADPAQANFCSIWSRSSGRL
jgi:hypothetical protein